MSLVKAINAIGHVIVGFGLVYLFIPTANIFTQIVFVLGAAAIREHIQHLRKTHPQSEGSRAMDIAEFGLGCVGPT